MLQKKIQIHPYVNRDDVDVFQKLYPNCMALFVRRAVHMAVQDSQFFESVFFNEELFYSRDGSV